MSIFSTDTLERVRAANDIVDVIGTALPLKRAGGNFVALCPFHKEKTPSFHVNPHRQIFHCFGCHKGGDVFSFVREYESIDFPEAVRRLAERARIPIEFEKGGGPDQQARFLKEKLLQIHDQIAQRWHQVLLTDAAGQVARDYLAKRGVSQEAVTLFRLGCAPEAWDDTVNWARSRGHQLGDVEKAGLILKRENAEGYYDRFRGRLMFPICDEQGRVIAFSGRILSGDEKTAKYVNSPETPIFTKSKTFYGLDKSKRALLDAGSAIVCEGQLDLIACFMAGVRNVVAPQGTAFTSEHARIIKRYTNEVVLCFDSDAAGQNAAVRSLDSLLASGLAIRVAVVPAPHDPDSFIRSNGAPAFQELLAKADGFFDFFLNRLCSLNDVGTDRGRLAVLKAMAEAVHKTANLVLIDKYAQKTGLRLGVSPDAVRAEFKKFARSLKSHASPEPASPAPPEDAAGVEPMPEANVHESWLLKLLLLNDELVPWAADHLHLDWIPHELVRQIVRERVHAHQTGTWTSLAAFLDLFPNPAAQNLITEAVTLVRPLPNPEQQLSDTILRLRNAALDRDLARLLQQTGLPGVDPEALLRQRETLRAQKRLPVQKLTP